MCFLNIPAAIPWVRDTNFDLAILQPARVGHALIKERRRGARESVVTVRPRCMLLRRRRQFFALKKWSPYWFLLSKRCYKAKHHDREKGTNYSEIGFHK